MLQEISITVCILLLFHFIVYYTNTDLMQWMKIDPVHYLFPDKTSEFDELSELKEQLEKKINEYKHA